MGLFDSFVNKAANQLGNAVKQGVSNAVNNKKEKIVFNSLPETYEQFISLPQASLSTPYETAAMAVLGSMSIKWTRKREELIKRSFGLIR